MRASCESASEDSAVEAGDAEDEDTTYVNGIGDGGGYFVDGKGRKIGGLFKFRVKDYEASQSQHREQGFLSIEGTTLSDVEEKELREQEFLRSQGSILARSRSRRDFEIAMSGALIDGDRADEHRDVESTPKAKYRMTY